MGRWHKDNTYLEKNGYKQISRCDPNAIVSLEKWKEEYFIKLDTYFSDFQLPIAMQRMVKLGSRGKMFF